MAIPRSLERAINTIVSIGLASQPTGPIVNQLRQPRAIERAADVSSQYQPELGKKSSDRRQEKRSPSSQAARNFQDALAQQSRIQENQEINANSRVERPNDRRRYTGSYRRVGENNEGVRSVEVEKVVSSGRYKREGKQREALSIKTRIERSRDALKSFNEEQWEGQKEWLSDLLAEANASYAAYTSQSGNTKHAFNNRAWTENLLAAVDDSLGIGERDESEQVGPANQDRKDNQTYWVNRPDASSQIVRNANGEWEIFQGDVPSEVIQQIVGVNPEAGETVGQTGSNEILVLLGEGALKDVDSAHHLLPVLKDSLRGVLELDNGDDAVSTVVPSEMLEKIAAPHLARLVLVRLKEGMDAEQILTSPDTQLKLDQLSAIIPIEAVAPNGVVRLFDNGERSIVDRAKWGIQAIGAEDNGLFPDGCGSENQAVVAIVDTGKPGPGGHSLFPWTNEGERTEQGNLVSDGLDNDDNGYVDDINGPQGFDRPDDYFHGSAMNDVIASVVERACGDTSESPVKVLNLKAGNKYGIFTWADIFEAYAYAMFVSENTPVVMNSSFGAYYRGYDDLLKIVEAVMVDVKASGVVPIAAGGNDGLDMRRSETVPAVFSIPVEARRENGGRPWWSNFDPEGKAVGAPGVNTVVAIPRRFKGAGFAPPVFSLLPKGESIAIEINGTSLAAPHVSAIAALMLAQNPELTPDQIHQMLLSSEPDVIRIVQLPMALEYARRASAELVVPPGIERGVQVPFRLILPDESFTHWYKDVVLNPRLTEIDGSEVDLKLEVFPVGPSGKVESELTEVKVRRGENRVSFDTHQFETGWYIFRLTAATSQDKRDAVERLQLINNQVIPIKEDWPIRIGFQLGTPQLVDIDGDGAVDHFVDTGNGSANQYYPGFGDGTQGFIYLVGLDGDIEAIGQAPEFIDPHFGRDPILFHANPAAIIRDPDGKLIGFVVGWYGSWRGSSQGVDYRQGVQVFSPNLREVADIVYQYHQSGTTIKSIPTTPIVSSPDGQFLFYAMGGTVFKLDVKTNEPVALTDEGVVVPSSKNISLVDFGGKTAVAFGPLLLDANSGEVLAEFPGIPGVNLHDDSVEFGPMVAGEVSGETIIFSSVRIFDSLTNNVISYVIGWTKGEGSGKGRVIFMTQLGSHQTLPDGMSFRKANDGKSGTIILTNSDRISMIDVDSGIMRVFDALTRRPFPFASKFGSNPRIFPEEDGRTRIVVNGRRSAIVFENRNGVWQPDVNSPLGLNGLSDISCYRLSPFCVVTDTDFNVTVWRNDKPFMGKGGWLTALHDERNSAFVR